jgi:hypothetical protein
MELYAVAEQNWHRIDEAPKGIGLLLLRAGSGDALLRDSVIRRGRGGIMIRRLIPLSQSSRRPAAPCIRVGPSRGETGRKFALAMFAALALFSAPAMAQTVAQTTNGSVVITTGATFQTVLAAVTSNNQRRSLTINNNNATDACWVFLGSGTAAKGTSIMLLAGATYARYYPYIPSDAIQATCATSADTLYVDTQ